jgi:hypothetical protein
MEDMEPMEVFDWLVEQNTAGDDLAAASMMFAWLEAIADGESAIRGAPTDLPSEVLSKMGPEQRRERIEDIDLEKREWLLQILGTGVITEALGAERLRFHLNQLKQCRGGMPNEDWYGSASLLWFVAGLCHEVRLYRRLKQQEEERRWHAEGGPQKMKDLLEEFKEDDDHETDD